jgi:hypothetical protein
MTLEEKGRAALSYIKSIEDKRKEAAKLTARLKHQALLMVRGIDPEQIASIRTPPGARVVLTMKNGTLYTVPASIFNLSNPTDPYGASHG